jgi:hypothetical protein
LSFAKQASMVDGIDAVDLDQLAARAALHLSHCRCAKR